jgi:hypothetical protein
MRARTCVIDERSCFFLNDRAGFVAIAPFRPDNLPDFQQDDRDCDVAATPGRIARA